MFENKRRIAITIQPMGGDYNKKIHEWEESGRILGYPHLEGKDEKLFG
jgi:hypothetical protein